MNFTRVILCQGLGFVVKMYVKVWEISVMKKNIMKQMKGDKWFAFPQGFVAV